MTISVLPPELVLRVADDLDPEDVFSLSQASRSLAYLIRFPALCRRVLMARAPYSPEALRAQKDGDYARGFRALVKRRNAIRMAKPFHVAFLALGTSFVYTNGVLCYATDGGQLRVLDIKNSAAHELVVDVFEMLRQQKEALPDFSHHRLRPIHFGHGVLTCELALTKEIAFAHPTRYLIVIKPHTPELLLFEEQPLRDRTVVTTTEKYLFLCHPVRDVLWNCWTVRQFDLSTGRWAHSGPRFISDASRRGNCMAVAVYEDRFYAVSSKEPLIRAHPVGAHCVFQVASVPLSPSSRIPLQLSTPHSAWAGLYSGRVFDERWDFLRLERDEVKGGLMATQIRVEYSDGDVNTRRKCIKRVLASLGTVNAPTGTTSTTNYTLTSSPGHGYGGQTVSILEGSSGPHDSGYPRVDAGSVANQQGFGSSYPASQPKTILHYGDTSLTEPYYGISQCFIRSYFSTSNSFVDLVNDTLRNNGMEQSLRLRAITETPGGDNETAFWPPKYDPSKPDPRLKELHRIMNPPGFYGDLKWEVDSGSFVYGMNASSTNNQKAIIYVGFDPTVKLHRLRAFNKARSRETEANGQSGAVGEGGNGPVAQGQTKTDADDETLRTFPPLAAPWAWMEEPLYLRPRGRNGFDFFG